ncbi:MAG: SDR family oxidoreductase [Spirochaetes bacterium]|nr:SDR family oxidoreductase [Spirochaetota bacterium]
MDDAHRLAGRRAFVLGGTGGIGFRVASALAGFGASLDLHGGSAEGLERALASLQAAGAEASGTAGRIASMADASFAWERAGRADILVCAFGPFLQKPLHETMPEEWKLVADLDLALPGALVSTAIAGMRTRGFGRIALFGGTRTDGIRGFRTNAAYAAVKTGLSSLAKSVAAVYAAEGIAALTICPGFVDTEYLDEGLRADLASRSPRGRLVPAQGIAELVARLLADGDALWNGSVLNADDGLISW